MTFIPRDENDLNQNESNTGKSQDCILPPISKAKLNVDPLPHSPIFHDSKEFVCGWGAAFINIAVTYPIYKVIFRQMLHGVGTSYAFHQLTNEGIFFLYRGIFPPLCQKTASLSIMFGMYDQCRRPLMEASVSPTTAKVIAAMVAGSIEAILMPFERIQTLLQDQTYHTHFKNSSHAFKILGLNYGMTEYYRGLMPILLRNGPSNAMFFLLRDEVKLQLPEQATLWRQMGQEFVSGALIGAFTSTVFYPLNVVKVQMQCQIGGEFQNFWKVLSQITKERGLRNMYKGVHLNYTRAFISWGVINAAYEFLKKIIH